MRELDTALTGITEIRRQIARTTEFHGYGPATLAATGALAFAAAAVQSAWLADPVAHVTAYLTLWIATASIAVGLVGTEMLIRSRRHHSRLAAEMVWGAVEQFVPAGMVGALLTMVLMRYAPESAGLLPGLWQSLFCLGLFASGRFLPRAAFLVGVWYLASGLASIAFARGAWALSPWTMGLSFGIGQSALALIVLRRDRSGDVEH
jgi:hypothetical protein